MKNSKLIKKQLLLGTWHNSNSTICFKNNGKFVYNKSDGKLIVEGKYLWSFASLDNEHFEELDNIILIPPLIKNNLFALNEKILKNIRLTQEHFSFLEDDLRLNYHRKGN